MSHDDDLLDHYHLCTRSCFPWFQRWTPQTQGSPKMEEGSLRWKNRAEPVQGSCRHKKWSRRLLSYHLKILDLGDCYPSGLGVICKNIHTVTTKSFGVCVRTQCKEDEAKIRSTHKQLWASQSTPGSGLLSSNWSQHCGIKRAKEKNVRFVSAPTIKSDYATEIYGDAFIYERKNENCYRQSQD